MKKNILYVFLGTFLLVSCQQEDTPFTSGEGYLSLTGIEIQNQAVTEVKSRAVDESWIVKLYKGGELKSTLTAEELENTIKLEAATDYSLKVYSENYGSDAEWTNDEKGEPIYYKEQPFEVKGGEITPVKVQVPMVNFAVKLSMPASLDWISDYTFTVASGERKVTLQDDEIAYFPYIESASFSYTLQLTNTDNEEFTLSGEYGADENKSLAFNTCYVVTYQMATQSLSVANR